MSNEEKINELLALYESYEKKANELLLLKESIEKKIKEFMVVVSSISALRETNEEYIFPLSSQAYVMVGSVKKDKIFVNVGSNVVVEMGFDEAENYFKELASKYEEEKSKIDKMINDIVKHMEEIKKNLEIMGVV